MGTDYSISFDPKVEVEGDDCYGSTVHDTQSIHIADGYPHDLERNTVLHECLHQMFSLAHLGLEPEVEEKVCTFLGAAVVGHIRDNPGLWRYLTQKPPKESQ